MPSENIAFLQDDGIDLDTLAAAEKRAAAMSVPASKVLMDFGILSQEKYFQRVSVELGLEFEGQTPVDPLSFFDLPKPLELERMARMVAVGPKDGLAGAGFNQSIVHVAPDGRQFSALKKLLAQSPNMRRRLRVTTPASNMASLIMRSRKALINYAVEGLFSTYPQFSAKMVFSARQAVVLVLVFEALLVAWFVWSSSLLISLHALASTFYLGCIALRLYSCLALVSKQNNPVSRTVIPAQDDRLLPTYSILVALYEETDQVEDLVQALSYLDWPRERLEIKLICEEDDLATLQACRRATDHFGGSIFSVIAVPKCHPRTKPKALNYALPLCLGAFVVVYDAEDRPHPMQLREAHSAFNAGSPRLACIQAPLCIHNHQDGWLVRLFAIEYSALFAGMFPAIAKMNLPMPLGGTSNHFKRQVLQAIGGWDPYNVTEDADLGIRLARAGCLVDTIASPTYEEAPASFSVWLKQRSRWFKGWYTCAIRYS
jgi:hypothetical protein